MLSIEEKILTLSSLRLLPVAALRFTFYGTPSYQPEERIDGYGGEDFEKRKVLR